MHYAGDIDPEGLGIAQKLSLRYPKYTRFWKMGLDDYYKSIADVEISMERLKKLDSIFVSDLIPVAEKIREKKQPGYQEALVTEMIEELKTMGY